MKVDLRRSWHRVQCPKCGKGVGVTPQNMIVMHGYSKLFPTPCPASGRDSPYRKADILGVNELYAALQKHPELRKILQERIDDMGRLGGTDWAEKPRVK